MTWPLWPWPPVLLAYDLQCLIYNVFICSVYIFIWPLCFQHMTYGFYIFIWPLCWPMVSIYSFDPCAFSTWPRVYVHKFDPCAFSTWPIVNIIIWPLCFQCWTRRVRRSSVPCVSSTWGRGTGSCLSSPSLTSTASRTYRISTLRSLGSRTGKGR